MSDFIASGATPHDDPAISFEQGFTQRRLWACPNPGAVRTQKVRQPTMLTRVLAGADHTAARFHKSRSAASLVGCDWKFDPDSPIFLIVSEFSILAQSFYLESWPFLGPSRVDEDYWNPHWRKDAKWVSRLNRRMATKARKERARTGLKRPRSKMPGAWT